MADLSTEIQQQVLAARDAKQTLNIVGGGSKSFMGREAVGERLDISGHRGIVNYQPVELVLTARAGTPLTEIEAALAENNQMLAFEPPRFSGVATLGGTLACNQSGPGRPWTGSVRDHVLGVRLINGLGEHLKFGGQVMKNVAGYDVSRLQAGAMGSLGVITEISLKVLPKPAASRTLVWDMGAEEAIVFMNQLAARPKPLSAACWLLGRCYVRLSGALSAVEATVKEWKGTALTQNQADQFWQQLGQQELPFFDTDLPLWRFSVNSAAGIPSLDELSLIDWGGAQRWFRGEQDKLHMESLAATAGGQVSLYAGGERRSEVMHTTPAVLQAIQKRIKASFDPDGIFNPGRLYHWM
ncbi:glycolate oxidase subunit GlcE [Neptunomonas sp.]|uniref:glycolate oxidase subunit GlcE n=2 Tax=Neptunomonas sp. TaxID=1971898 RepID=UPI00356312F7